MIRAAILASLFLSAPALAADPPKITLKDGDRIVYIGNTFAERDAIYGYLETLLTIRHPEINFTFRNLGWSGDTVWGDARARFGTRADGFKHLKEHVLALKPTIILVAYGMNESFAGEAGLKDFEAGLNTLLDTLAETKAKVVLISPIPHEDLGPPLPDPAKHNADLQRYVQVMAEATKTRGIAYVDLFAQMNRAVELGRKFYKTTLLYTEDGLHPTGDRYSSVDWMLFSSLAQKSPGADWIRLEFGADGSVKGPGAKDARKIPRGFRVDVESATLCPPVTTSTDWKGGGIMLTFLGLPIGKYTILVDGIDSHHFEVTNTKSTMSHLYAGPEIDQVEKLRALINRKNELYFHRWRPQNETYLFGFRKHEQGNNAVEIPQFDPLIADLEAQINVLKKPVKHTYEILHEEAGK